MSDTKNMSLLERRFTFYASYHNNPVNQWIHIVCVPVIFWSALVLGAYIPVESLLNAIGQSSTEPLCTLGPLVVPRNVATLAVIVYMVYYLILSRLLGAIMAPLLLLALHGANVFLAAFGPELAWKLALAAHAVAWIMQFYGHGAHEGRAPALMDSLLESLTMAPLFVTIEATGKLGLMRDFHARVEPIVAANIAKFRAEQQQAKRAE